MGFLKKIFQRKKTVTESDLPAKKEKKNQSRKGKARPPPSHTASNSSPERDVEKESGRLTQPRSSPSEKARLRNSASFPQDENFDHSNAASSTSPRLSYQHLQQFDRQNTHTSFGAHSVVHQPIFQMSPALPRQQIHAMDDMARSDASSSSFNLSTDAEDSDYENFRSRGVLPETKTNASVLDMSVSAASIPASYITEDEKIFPALDDLTVPSVTTATSAKEQELRYSALDPAYSQQQQMASKLGLMPPPPPSLPPRQPQPTPGDEPGRLQISPKDEPGRIKVSPRNVVQADSGSWQISPSTEASHEPESTKSAKSDSRSWGASPTTAASMEPFSTKTNKSKEFFNFEDPALNVSNTSEKDFSFSNTNLSSQNSRNFSESPKEEFTSPKSQASNTSGFVNNDFDDFADFSNFKKFDEEQTETKGNARGDFDRAFDEYQDSPKNQFISSPTSANQQDKSLSELLALAKNKKRNSTTNRRYQRRLSNSSTQSSPTFTSSYLRQQHNLGKYTKSGYGDRYDREGSRVSNDETSVSDIIESLEVSNKMRRGGRNISSTRSLGDTGSSAIALLAKERLREKKRREAEYNAAMGVQSSDSSDNSDHEPSESWQFDGVTNALGPRGIAADLESLSGRSTRSNRSNYSQGNRSHRSRHSKSHRSSRRPRSSNDSVDSFGSRHSRNSRTSRYSHKSTKSYISQMSQESRSVANDLLRLEMQLAMVGSHQENRDDVPVVAVSANTGPKSMSNSSRRSRTGRKPYISPRSSASSLSKRIKVTVTAPPGKLGIILANKADSKGTVVSGVRTSSPLVERVTPGDRIIAIDGEDVSRMTVSEITTIMSRKAPYERNLTILTFSKHTVSHDENTNIRSPSKSNEEASHNGSRFDTSY